MSRLHSTEHFDLHNDDGTHRSTCSTADGTRVAQHEENLRRHLLAHDDAEGVASFEIHQARFDSDGLLLLSGTRVPTEPDDDADCHPDCGPITIRSPDGTHAHEHPLDGRCWHLDDESDGTLEDSLAEESDT